MCANLKSINQSSCSKWAYGCCDRSDSLKPQNKIYPRKWIVYKPGRWALRWSSSFHSFHPRLCGIFLPAASPADPASPRCTPSHCLYPEMEYRKYPRGGVTCLDLCDTSRRIHQRWEHSSGVHSAPLCGVEMDGMVSILLDSCLEIEPGRHGRMEEWKNQQHDHELK